MHCWKMDTKLRKSHSTLSIYVSYHLSHVEKICAHLMAGDSISLNHVKRYCSFEVKVLFDSLANWLTAQKQFCCNLECHSVSYLAIHLFFVQNERKTTKSNLVAFYDWNIILIEYKNVWFDLIHFAICLTGTARRTIPV